MKVTLEQFPHNYNQYPWSPEPDNVNYFVGREIELMGFWYEMANLVGTGQKQHSNMAFVGQRKLGKTAYLKRCYNIAFWEQEEVVPFYYSFAQDYAEGKEGSIQLKKLQRDMPLKLIKQFLAFLTRDEKVCDLKNYEEVFEYLQKSEIPSKETFIRGIKSSLDSINEQERLFILKETWEMTQWLTLIARKKCLLIIDEAQEMDSAIFDGDELIRCKGSIVDIIQKTHSLVIVSGSHVSMLVHDFLDYKVANRFRKITFDNLENRDAIELVDRLIKNGYLGLAEDLIQLVGKNPYYISTILSFNIKYYHSHKEQKDFSSKEGLMKAYDFEVFDEEGILFDFWNTHLQQNRDDLNRDSAKQKGMTLQILYKVAKNPGVEFYYFDLVKEFGVDEETIVKKVKQLEHANLLKPMGISRYAYGFPDKVLPVVINNAYHDLIIKGPNRRIAQEAVEDHLRISKYSLRDVARIKAMLEEADQNFAIVEKEIAKINWSLLEFNKKIKAARGKINFRKGMAKESEVRTKVREMIEKSEGMFADYKLQGEVNSVNFTNSGGTGCQIDVYAKLIKQQGKKKQTITFIAEVKNTKTKTSLKDAQKFVASITSIKNEKKLKDIHAIYISSAGFVTTAQKYLESFKIDCTNTFS